MLRISFLLFLSAVSVSTSAAQQAEPVELVRTRLQLLPPVEAVVEVQPLLDELRTVTGPRAGPVLLGVAFEARGAPQAVTATHTALPAEFTEPLRKAVERHLKPQPGATSLNLLVRGGSDPRATVVQALTITAPELKNGAELATRISRGRQRSRAGDQRTQRRLAEPKHAVVAGVAIPEGTLAEARIVQSTGDERLDREALRAAAYAAFTPGTVDGLPVAMPVRLPLTFRW